MTAVKEGLTEERERAGDAGPIDELPPEVLSLVLSQLLPQDMMVQRCSRRWRDADLDASYWKPLFLNTFALDQRDATPTTKRGRKAAKARGRRGSHVLHGCLVRMFGRALNLRRSANLESQVLHGPIAWSTNALDDAPQYYERVCLRRGRALRHWRRGHSRPCDLRPRPRGRLQGSFA